MADRTNTPKPKAEEPPTYWPICNRASFPDYFHDLRVATSALHFSILGMNSFTEENCPREEDGAGLAWLSRLVWEMAESLEEMAENGKIEFTKGGLQ